MRAIKERASESRNHEARKPEAPRLIETASTDSTLYTICASGPRFNCIDWLHCAKRCKKCASGPRFNYIYTMQNVREATAPPVLSHRMSNPCLPKIERRSEKSALRCPHGPAKICYVANHCAVSAERFRLRSGGVGSRACTPRLVDSRARERS